MFLIKKVLLILRVQISSLSMVRYCMDFLLATKNDPCFLFMIRVWSDRDESSSVFPSAIRGRSVGTSTRVGVDPSPTTVLSPIPLFLGLSLFFYVAGGDDIRRRVSPL